MIIWASILNKVRKVYWLARIRKKLDSLPADYYLFETKDFSAEGSAALSYFRHDLTDFMSTFMSKEKAIHLMSNDTIIKSMLYIELEETLEKDPSKGPELLKSLD